MSTIYRAASFEEQTQYVEDTVHGALDRSFLVSLCQIVGTAWLTPDDPALTSLAPIRMDGWQSGRRLEWDARIVNVEMRQVAPPGSAPVWMAYVSFVSEGPYTRL